MNQIRLEDLFGRPEAAERLGCTIQTMLNRHNQGVLVGIPLGSRQSPDDGENPLAFVYTERMLTAYEAGERPVTPTDEELRQVMSLADVQALTGLTRTQIEYASLPSCQISRMHVFLRHDVEEYVRTGLRVEVRDGRLPDSSGYDLAQAMTDYRSAHGLSQQGLTELVGFPEVKQLRQILGRIERRETIRVKRYIVDRLLAIVKGE